MGKKPKKPVIFSFSQKVVGLPYQLGMEPQRKGLDCFSLVIEYLKTCGVSINPDEMMEGITFENYADRYNEDNNVIRIAEKYLSKVLKNTPPHHSQAGDVLGLAHNAKRFLGIDAGNGMALSVNPLMGVRIIKKKYYDIIRAWAIR